MTKGLKRAAARGAVAVVLAAGAAVGAVGTASAAPLHDHHAPDHRGAVTASAASLRDHRAPDRRVVGTASAVSLRDRHAPKERCKVVPGHWERVWHPVYRDRNHHQHAGYWTRVWKPAHRECRR